MATGKQLRLLRQGRLNLDDMVSRHGLLEDVNEAFRAMEAGEVARTILMFVRSMHDVS